MHLEAQLIRNAQSGSTDALERLFECCGERLLPLIRWRLESNHCHELDCRDIVQETLLKAFERIGQFRGSGARSFMGWLGAIARNEVLDQLKYARREVRDVGRRVSLEEVRRGLAARGAPEVSRLDAWRERARLRNALLRLSDEHRQVIVLRRFEELSYLEIAERMGRSADACRMLHSRAMAALTRQMKGRQPVR